MALYRILSFDGGGIRGLLSTVLIRRLVAESTVSDLIGQADMFAGTSTGGRSFERSTTMVYSLFPRASVVSGSGWREGLKMTVAPSPEERPRGE